MALLHMDGCDTYTSTTDVAARYPGTLTSNITLNATGGRFGGCSISPNSAAGSGYLGPISLPHSGTGAIIVGGAVTFASISSVNPYLFINNTLGNASSGTELSLYWDNGLLRLYRGLAAGTLLASTTQTFPASMWHHIEVKATVADSGGNVEVRMNGQTVINYTGDTRVSTTGTAGIDRVYLASYASGLTGGMWDDFYAMDTTGTALNNFIGDCRVNTLAPTSDASIQFTRSTGASNYLTVDEGRMNSDTDYVESATVGHIDRYGFADLAAAVATVHAVQPITWARKTDAATRTMRNLVVSGGTTSTGTSYSLLTGYAPYVTTLATDPATSAAWTPSAVNALTAGVEVVS